MLDTMENFFCGTLVTALILIHLLFANLEKSLYFSFFNLMSISNFWCAKKDWNSVSSTLPPSKSGLSICSLWMERISNILCFVFVVGVAIVVVGDGGGVVVVDVAKNSQFVHSGWSGSPLRQTIGSF